MLDKVVDALIGETVHEVLDKLKYSEIRLRLLKQFNLIPDTPPNDFEGVYVYTLIEYGLGKEKVILQLFKETEIKEEFRKAFNENRKFNDSILDNFIQSSDIGDKIKDQNIDYRRELTEFARLFIEIAKRARTATEILQDHKLDKIENSLQDLQEIKNQLAQLAQSQQPLLPPGEIPRETELAKQLRKWFEALGYKFENHEVLEKDYFQWIINIPKRRGYDRIFIHGVEAEAGINDINTVKKAVETYKTDEGWIIAPGRVSKLAREEVKKAENKQILCYTFDELIEENADFTGYFDWLEREVKSRGIDQYYVPLACTKEEINPHKQRIGISHYGEEDGWIEGYINQWLDDPVKEHLSVLGEFGTGKTWFAFHYAWLALQEYLKAKEKGTQRPRIPLVIPLRDYAKALRIEFLFLEFFFLKHKGLAKYTAFEQLNRMGKLLLIFDGFDEMAARVDRQAMINNFWELAKVVGTPGTKAILTCRTEHFPEALEGRSILNAELKASTSNLTGESPQFEVLELEKFDDQQIKQVLNFKTTPETVDSIINNEKLLDLARRPVMIDLIIEALPDIEAGKPVDISRVYLYAVRQKMERDIKADRTFTSMTDKLYFLCELSWEMLSNDKMSLNYKEFPDMIQRRNVECRYKTLHI